MKKKATSKNPEREGFYIRYGRVSAGIRPEPDATITIHRTCRSSKLQNRVMMTRNKTSNTGVRFVFLRRMQRETNATSVSTVQSAM